MGSKGLLDLIVLLPLLGGACAVTVCRPVGCPTANGFIIGVTIGKIGKADAEAGVSSGIGTSGGIGANGVT